MAGGTFESDTDGTFHCDIPGTFQSVVDGTFNSATAGTFQSDMGGTFGPLLSIVNLSAMATVFLALAGWDWKSPSQCLFMYAEHSLFLRPKVLLKEDNCIYKISGDFSPLIDSIRRPRLQDS